MMQRPRRFSTTSGMMSHWLVDQEKDLAFLLVDRIVLVDVMVVTIDELEREYRERTVIDRQYDVLMEALRTSALQVGMTALAGKYLTKFVPFNKTQFNQARDIGDATVARWKSEATKMEKQDMADKAPRKLAGAALKAKETKERREAEARAAEARAAKDVALEVSDNLTAAEEAGAKDVRLDTKKPKGVKPVAKDEVAKEVTKRVTKAVKEARADGFDYTKLKTQDGAWRSASAMFKGLIVDNEKLTAKKRLTDDQIFEAVQTQFGLTEDKRSYVQWNRNWLRKNGVTAAEVG